MRRSRIVVAVVLLLVGLLFIGQGSGQIGGGAMAGSMFWAIVGVVLAAAGLVIGAREIAGRRVARS